MTLRAACMIRLLSILCLCAGLPGAQRATPERPNVLWIYVEDMSPLVGAYGYPVETPALDRLAAEGVLFERCFVPHPVCSASRSGMINGVYATSLGLHQHRSSRTPDSAIHLPEGWKSVPQLFREAGYWTFNHGGKLDYNFVYERSDWYDSPGGRPGFYQRGQAAPWAGCPDGVPFFGQVQLRGGKESRRPEPRTDPSTARLPAYYPDHPVLRDFFAYQMDAARMTDDDVDALLAALDADGLREDTLVIFMTDHGMRCLRDKQFCYDGGLRVPVMLRWPGGAGIEAGTRRSEITSTLDLVGTSLWAAGIEIPERYECQPLFGEDYAPREYVVGARDRCDFTIDRIRTVRTDRFRYVRNYLTDRAYTQPTYKLPSRSARVGGVFEYMLVLPELYEAGELNEAQAWFLAPERPAEELYEHASDPDETVNLAGDPRHAAELERHRALLEAWIVESGDQGQQPEPESGLRAVLDQWGERCVNPEYDALRAADAERDRDG